LCGEFFGGFARRSVDDGRTVGFFFEEIGGEFVAARFGEFDDFDGEVVTAKAVDEKFGVVELKLGDDVCLNGGRCCCCECNDGGGAKGGKEIAKGAVVGAEVMAPG